MMYLIPRGRWCASFRVGTSPSRTYPLNIISLRKCVFFFQWIHMCICTMSCIHCTNNIVCSEYAYLYSWCATEACFHTHVHRSMTILLWSLSPLPPDPDMYFSNRCYCPSPLPFDQNPERRPAGRGGDTCRCIRREAYSDLIYLTVDTSCQTRFSTGRYRVRFELRRKPQVS